MTGRARPGQGNGAVVDEVRMTPGLGALLLAALAIGILMLAVQLWLLTVSLDLYLGGHGDGVLSLAVVSGAIFVGGLLALRLLSGGQAPRR